MYDLFECLAGQMDINGLSTIPMFFVSPVADSSLAYSNIMAEWLSATKQNRVYLPDEPFPHGNLAKSGRLKSFRSLHDENFSTEYRQVSGICYDRTCMLTHQRRCSTFQCHWDRRYYCCCRLDSREEWLYCNLGKSQNRSPISDRTNVYLVDKNDTLKNNVMRSSLYIFSNGNIFWRLNFS